MINKRSASGGGGRRGSRASGGGGGGGRRREGREAPFFLPPGEGEPASGEAGPHRLERREAPFKLHPRAGQDSAQAHLAGERAISAPSQDRDQAGALHGAPALRLILGDSTNAIDSARGSRQPGKTRPNRQRVPRLRPKLFAASAARPGGQRQQSSSHREGDESLRGEAREGEGRSRGGRRGAFRGEADVPPQGPRRGSGPLRLGVGPRAGGRARGQRG